jgi:hypothetical protein
MRADAGLTEDPHYLSVLAQGLVSCTIIALFMQHYNSQGQMTAAVL